MAISKIKIGTVEHELQTTIANVENLQTTLDEINNKLDYTNIAYGTCSTAAATAAKVITISGNTNWTLTAGSTIIVKFSATNTASNPTFNVNGTGAKSVWYGTAVITTSSLNYAGYKNRPMKFVYDGTQYVFMGWSYDTNSDTKVTQEAAITTAGEYPVMLGYNTSTSSVTNTLNKTSTLKYNPSTQVLTAPTFKGNSVIIGTGDAQGEFSAAGGTNDSDLVSSFIGSSLGSLASIDTPTAYGDMSLSFGAGTKSYTTGTVALGANATAGAKGFYWHSISYVDGKPVIQLTTEQKPYYVTQIFDGLTAFNQTPTWDSTAAEILSNWEVGDALTIVHKKKYGESIIIESINSDAGKITVNTLPFTYNDRDYRPSDILLFMFDDISIYNPSKPNDGLFQFALGAVSIGLETNAAGSFSMATGWKSRTTTDFAHAEGIETVADYAAHAEGSGAKAIGKISHAEGANTTASGYASHTEGDGTVASGAEAHAEGGGSQATAWCSHAEGHLTEASGSHSHAEGDETRADGVCAHTEGYMTSAKDYSHAEGYSTNAEGAYSHTEGVGTFTGANSAHAEGENTEALGTRSHAEGYLTKALNENSHAEGYNTQAIGGTSHAEGHTTEAKYAAHAEGGNTKAYGNYSHAEGYNTEAKGSYSHTEGRYTDSIGEASHAEGAATLTNAYASHAEGIYTIASSEFQHVQGKYNIEDSENKYAHIVGNGTDNTKRSNAHTLDWEGNAWYSNSLSIGNVKLTFNSTNNRLVISFN